jgi:hypothetical protein
MTRTTLAALATLIVLATACGDRADTTPTYLAAPATASADASASVLQNFGLNGLVSGFPTGRVFITGGGAFDATTASNTADAETRVVATGGFRCIESVQQGPLANCAGGEGVRWDTAQLLASTNFRCRAADAAKAVTTGSGLAVLLADFYRAGDGIDESFTAQMIVADHDLVPEIDGEQNLWIQGVGCATAVVHFGR